MYHITSFHKINTISLCYCLDIESICWFSFKLFLYYAGGAQILYNSNVFLSAPLKRSELNYWPYCKSACSCKIYYQSCQVLLKPKFKFTTYIVEIYIIFFFSIMILKIQDCCSRINIFQWFKHPRTRSINSGVNWINPINLLFPITCINNWPRVNYWQNITSHIFGLLHAQISLKLTHAEIIIDRVIFSTHWLFFSNFIDNSLPL